MQPARFRQEDFSLVKIDNAQSMSPAVSSGKERGLLSRTAAGNRAYVEVRNYKQLRKLETEFTIHLVP